MKMIETRSEKLTERECLEIGGHCWSERYDSRCGVDEFGNLNGIMLSVAVKDPIFLRKCKHCGKQQQLIPEKWEDIKE